MGLWALNLHALELVVCFVRAQQGVLGPAFPRILSVEDDWVAKGEGEKKGSGCCHMWPMWESLN